MGISASANYSFTFGEFDRAEETCTLLSFSGTAPANGQMVIPNHYTNRDEGKVYRVYKIADHALDNIPDVKEIVIPQNVEQIGDADYLGFGGTNNFNNCPQLAKFTVDEENKAFQSIDGGVLRQRYSFCLERVPTLLEVENGTFTLFVSYRTVVPGAFAGNTTISTLVFNPNIELVGDTGLSSMRQLKVYRMAGDPYMPEIQLSNNMIYSLDGTKLFTCPPAQTASSVTFLSSLKEIAPGAFANVANLESLGLSLDNLTIGEGAFRNCGKLSQVFITGKNCTLGKACFKGCSKLSDFLWSNNLDFANDSIFAGCGFTEITFPAGELPAEGITMGHAMFDGCQSLAKIDMSKVQTAVNQGHVRFKSFVTSNCPNLTTFYFPPITDFLGSASGNPNMGFNSNIQTIRLGGFSLENNDCAVFEYKDKLHSPVVYYTPNDSPYYTHPFKYMFGFAYPGQLDLTIYSQMSTLLFGPPHERYSWAMGNATYWVPGASFVNYTGAFDVNAKLNEMFYLHNYDCDGKLLMKFTTFDNPAVTINRVYVNDLNVGAPDANGYVDTRFDVASARNAHVEYTVNGITFHTYYSSIDDVQAAVETIADDATSLDVKIEESILRFTMAADYLICDIAGKIVKSGYADCADCAFIPSGIYLVKLTAANGQPVVKKVVL